jgi:hypothetical protein
MARQASPDSVSTKVAQIGVDETIVFQNPYTSVMVMVSLLKKKEAHSNKIFKIKYVDNKTSVTRVK